MARRATRKKATERIRLLWAMLGSLPDNHQACQRAKAEHKPDKVKLGFLIIHATHNPGRTSACPFFSGNCRHVPQPEDNRPGVADKLDRKAAKINYHELYRGSKTLRRIPGKIAEKTLAVQRKQRPGRNRWQPTPVTSPAFERWTTWQPGVVEEYGQPHRRPEKNPEKSASQ